MTVLQKFHESIEWFPCVARSAGIKIYDSAHFNVTSRDKKRVSAMWVI